MQSNDNFFPTLIDIFNLFYTNGFPSILGAKATAVAMAVIYKWNSLFRPAMFRMANAELCHLSGVTSNIERSRQRICDLCKIDGIPLFTYVSNGTRRGGTYRINGNLAANLRQINGNLADYYKRSQSKRSETEKSNDHDQSSSENENAEKEILTGTTASDHTIVLGAIMRKWGSQIIQQPPLTQVTAALQEHPRETLLEALERAPLVLKEPDTMKIMSFIVKVAEHPMWYLDKADVLEIQAEDAKQRAKEKRLIDKCEAALMSAVEDGSEEEIYGYVRFLSRHIGLDEPATFSNLCPSLTKPLDYYKSIWADPGDGAYE